MVVTLSPFKANMDISDVLLPIAPFTETSGTFVNAEGRVQGFHAVVKPLGETRPRWKVLRVLANLMGVPGFDFESSQDVLHQARGAQDAGQTHVAAGKLDNTTTAPINLAAAGRCARVGIHLPAGRHRAPRAVAAADRRRAQRRHGRRCP
jgi:NADH-quinone oxidoreductase subunit G